MYYYSVMCKLGCSQIRGNKKTMRIYNKTSGAFLFQRQLYTLKVLAHDGGSPPRSSVTVVYMNVLDVNDNQPEFDPASYSQMIYENVKVGTTVINVSATDIDSGQLILPTIAFA